MFLPGSGMEAIITGIIGLGGMLVGGFVVYNRVESLVKDLKSEISRVENEQRDEFKQIWSKFDMMMPIQTCRERQNGCLMQFTVFKEGHEEIKALFRELRGDLKSELKLLRECISAITQGKC